MIYKSVVGTYEGWPYEVSDAGIVRSLRQARCTGWRVPYVLTQFPDRDGYLRVSMSPSGKGIPVMVHVLVAEAFIGVRPLGLTVNHKDGNKRNNAVSNLEWLSVEDNNRHATLNGLMPKGERNGRALLKETDVLEIYKRLRDGEKVGVLAVRYGIAQSTVSAIKARRIWQHLLMGGE